MRGFWLLIAVIAAAGLAGAAVAFPDRGAIVLALVCLAVLAVFGPRLATPVDRWLPGLLLIAYPAKLVTAYGALKVVEILYRGKADAIGYHNRALEAADTWRSLSVPETVKVTGTDFADLAISLLYAPYEPTLLGGYFLFATLGFIGQLFLYLAMRRAFPTGRLRLYALGVFFYPTVIYWTAPIGKEALMFLFIGPAIYGVVRMFQDFRIRWLFLIGFALLPATMLRAHVVALITAALLATVVLTRLPQIRELGARRVGAALLLLGSFAVVTVLTASQFNIELGATVSGGFIAKEVDPFLEDLEGDTSKGGSAVEGGFIRSPAEVPGAVIRVLFRPLPHEADNIASLVTGVEGLILLLVTLWRTPTMIRGLAYVRREPYSLFCLIYTLGFIWAFSGLLNLGLLARQRSQLIPFLFVLLLELRPAHRRPGKHQRRADDPTGSLVRT